LLKPHIEWCIDGPRCIQVQKKKDMQDKQGHGNYPLQPFSVYMCHTFIQKKKLMSTPLSFTSNSSQKEHTKPKDNVIIIKHVN
jgi:hypothetical protein